MHAIISCATTTPYSSDAGRLPIFAPIPSRPLHNVVDLLQAAALDFKVINPAKDAVTPLPVPLKFKRSRDSLDHIVLADHVALIRRIERLEALGVLEGKTGTVGRVQDLGRQGAFSGDSGDNGSGDASVVLAESGTSLKRARKINKRAGLDVLKRRETRKAHLLGGSILQAHLRP